MIRERRILSPGEPLQERSRRSLAERGEQGAGSRELGAGSEQKVWRREASRELGAGSWEHGASRRSGAEASSRSVVTREHSREHAGDSERLEPNRKD